MAQALDARDPYTAGHSDRVSFNSTAIAAAIGLTPPEVEVIRIGAKLHDIGKIGIPDAILQKPGVLTAEEFALIKLHPQIGKRILDKFEGFRDYLPIVELHHENQDGSGYPYGLKGHELPLGVRIVHVADVYDAVTSNRAYRKAMSERQVLDILMSGAGPLFDPEVVNAFLSILRQRKVLDGVLDATLSGVTGMLPADIDRV
jgi:HD-GYP domain-containing protein (c-di-GMP phosphodiesterase class II)